jgi:hypothetical protein
MRKLKLRSGSVVVMIGICLIMYFYTIFNIKVRHDIQGMKSQAAVIIDK